MQVAAIGADTLKVDGQTIKVYNYKDATQIPWKEHKVEIVAETSGVYTTSAKASDHLTAGAQYVVISAPPKDEVVPMLEKAGAGMFAIGREMPKSRTLIARRPSDRRMQKRFAGFKSR